MNKRNVGTSYENMASTYLQEAGIRIVEQNFRSRQGEIDLIGYDQGCLVFIEVKYRQNAKAGNPVEAVTKSKQRTICKVADYYRMIHKIGDFSAFRYDIVAICGEEITWYQNAFYHMT